MWDSSRETLERLTLKQTILHIGLEKTGTTSIQFLLSQNRNLLLESSVLVSNTTNPGNNYHLAIASYSKYRADGLTKQLGISSQQQLEAFRKRVFAKLAKEISQSKPEKVILSSEHFQSRLLGTDDIGLLKTSLESIGLTKFKILLYLRDPLKIVMSHHGMAIKKGIHVTDDFYRPEHPRISHIINHTKTLQNWQAVFGRDAIQVRLYPESQPGEALLTDFLNACEISREQVDMTKQELRNINLSASALRALNRMNATSDKIRLLAEDRWLFNQLEKRHPGKGMAPDQKTIDLFEQHFRAEHAQISSEWFDSQAALFASNWPAAETIDPEIERNVAEDLQKLIAVAMRKRRLSKLVRLPRRLAKRLLGR
jgi:hypothetical protein